MEFKSRLRTCLFLKDEGEVAAKHYVSTFPNSSVDNIVRPVADGPALVVEFTLNGAPFMVLNGNPEPVSSHLMSISVLTGGQAETDQLWDALLQNGGEEGRCGWLKDRFGVHWQIVPEALPRLMSGADPTRAARVQRALMEMQKIDVARLESA